MILSQVSSRQSAACRYAREGWLNGNMFCGVYKDFLILRLGEQNAENAQELPYVRPFDIAGRPMKGWVMVERGGFKSDDELQAWLSQARDFASALPPK